MMTLEEAIIHAEEVVDRCEVTDGDRACAEEHRQLAKWLKELQERRKADNEIPFGNASFSELDSIINAYEVHCNHKKVVELLKELRKRRKQPGWTQISEGYPKIGQRVLVTLVDGTMDIRRCKLAEYFDCYYGDVIAWMPAPEPYQSEAERRTDV